MKELNTRETQDRLLEMAKAIAEILDRNGIRWFIAFGTLLGAVRHQGFIPWDDDFDIHVVDEDYDKAIAALRKELPEELFVEDAESEPLYFHAWAHVKDLTTIAHCKFFPQDNMYAHKGLSVDLYRLTGMKDYEIPAFRAGENLNYQRRKYEKGIITEDEFRQKEQSLLELMENISGEKSGGGRDAFADLIVSCPIYPEEVYPLKEYSFEGTSFKGPKDADAYLSKIYGNYMELPPLESRKRHYDSVILI